jgi:hypothetical protein
LAFAAVRGCLPQPVLPDHPAWAAGYWRDWAAVWECLADPPAGSSLRGPLLDGRDGVARMADAAVVARLAAYGAGGFDLIHLLDPFYAAQQPDGLILAELSRDTGESCWLPFHPNSAAPDLAVWVEWRHYRLCGDEARLRAVFGPLLAHHRWLRRHRTWPGGLYWTTAHAAGLPTPPGEDPDYHHHRVWLEATLQANLSGLLLGRMGELLGETAAVEELTAERAPLTGRINAALWNEDTSLYHAIEAGGTPVGRRSLGASWALLDRSLATEERRKALVQAVRNDHNARRRATNGTASGGGPVSANGSGATANGGAASSDSEPSPEPLQTTPLAAYVTMRGAQAAGAFPLAHALAVGALGDGTLDGDDSATVALRILTVLEGVVGLSLDWPLHQVTWRNYLGHTAETGVRGLRLGDAGTADLLAAGGMLTVRSDVPFTFAYHDREQEFQAAVPAGVSTFELA